MAIEAKRKEGSAIVMVLILTSIAMFFTGITCSIAERESEHIRLMALAMRNENVALEGRHSGIDWLYTNLPLSSCDISPIASPSNILLTPVSSELLDFVRAENKNHIITVQVADPHFINTLQESAKFFELPQKPPLSMTEESGKVYTAKSYCLITTVTAREEAPRTLCILNFIKITSEDRGEFRYELLYERKIYRDMEL